MGLGELKNRIASDAESEISEINSEADGRISVLTESVRKSSLEKADKILKDAEAKADLAFKKIVSKARVEASSQVSCLKNQLIEDVFSEVSAKIESLSDKQKRQVLSNLVSGASRVGDDVVVYVDPKYKKLIPTSKQYTVVGKNLGVFGVVLSSADGLITVDNTLPAVIARTRDQLKPCVSEILYGGLK